MIVDSHQHFWRLDRGDYAWLTPQLGPLYRDYGPDDLAPLLAECEVNATVLVQAAASERETLYLFELARSNGFVAGVVGWVDFEAPDAARRIASLVSEGRGLLKGLRPMVQNIDDPNWLLRPALDRAFEATIEHGLAFDALVQPRHLEVLQQRLARHRELRAVLDHAGKPSIGERALEPWASDIARLASGTNVYCKLSGLVTECGERCDANVLDPYVAHVFSCFGSERVLWGSDWPVLSSRIGYARWYEMARDCVARHAAGSEPHVFGANAMRFYGLSADQKPPATGETRNG
ncbi:MAG: amidohydrolase family protein [Gammaproteobacteria bacterium]